MIKTLFLSAVASFILLFGCSKNNNELETNGKHLNSFTIINSAGGISSYDVEFNNGTTQYAYDAQNRITGISKSPSDIFQGPRFYSFAYNGTSQFPVRCNSKALAPGNVTDESHYYAYNDLNQLVTDSSVTNNITPAIIKVRTVSYPANTVIGYTISSRTQTNGTTVQSYTYDTARLDAAGNILQFVRKYNLGSTEELSIYNYTYDSKSSPFANLNIYKAGVYFQPGGIENPSPGNVITASQQRNYTLPPVNVNRDLNGGYTYRRDGFPAAFSKTNVDGNNENIIIDYTYIP